MQKRKHRWWIAVVIVLLILPVAGSVLYVLLEPRASSRTAISPANVSFLKNFVPENYQTVPMMRGQIFEGNLILVNSKNSCRAGTENFTRVYDEKNKAYKVKDKSVMMHKCAMLPMNQMMDAFYQETGIRDVLAMSGYRSEEEQAQIFQQKAEAKGEQEASKWAAYPGYSEHHTGYAVDLSIYHDNGHSEAFRGQGKYRWISENCHRYGFIIRYYEDKTPLTGVKYEPWHLRYIGVPHAELLTQRGFCLEEYIAYLKVYSFNTEHLIIEAEDKKKYEVYYVPAKTDITDVPVPKDREYTISGDNMEGFIVTCEL